MPAPAEGTAVHWWWVLVSPVTDNWTRRGTWPKGTHPWFDQQLIMPAHTWDKLPELVNSFFWIFELENSGEIRKQLAEEAEKLHREKPWDRIKAITSSSFDITEIMNKQGQWGKENPPSSWSSSPKSPQWLLITSSNNISVLILFIFVALDVFVFFGNSLPLMLYFFPLSASILVFCFVLFC